MGKRYGMRVGKRVGGVRVSAGRGGVRVGAGKQYGHARVGVSYSSRGGLGGGASFGTNAARVGTNGHGVSAGVTGKTGVVSYGAGLSTWGGRPAPHGFTWMPTGRRDPNYGHEIYGLARIGSPVAAAPEFTPAVVDDSLSDGEQWLAIFATTMRPWVFKLARRAAGRV